MKPRDNYFSGLSGEGFHRLYYREWGDPDNQDVIVCVHGVTRISNDFDILAKALSRKYRVVCPDIVGRGYSDWLGNKKNYNFVQYCTDMNALIAHVRADNVHWIGTSMGGIIGMMLAALSHTPIKTLILNDVGPSLKRTELRKIGQYIGKAPQFSNQKKLFEYYKNTYQSLGKMPKKDWQEMALYSAFKSKSGYRIHYDPQIGDAFRSSYSMNDFDLWQYWDEISCPTLLLRGVESTFFSVSIANKMIDRGYDVRYEEIPKVGHAPTLRTPYEINLIKKFYRSIK